VRTADSSRRSFLRSAACGAAGLLACGAPAFAQRRPSALDRFTDLKRHFLFEYYPWYRTDPWEHWDEWERRPPAEIASNFMPALGIYDSRAAATIERHARWIAEAGVGAIDVSWWGPDSNVNEVIPLLMDIMAAHDIHVTFYVEPYTDTHASNYARDLLYLIKNYGDRRHWDCFLLHEHADGTVGPVFKSFRTILLPTSTDCHGVTSAVADYATDDVWRRQTDAIRQMLKNDFDRLTLLADSTQVARTQACGFDGIALFDNYVAPDRWRLHADNCTSRNLVFSFQVNPGFDGIVRRNVEPGSCYTPAAFSPGGGSYNWTSAADRDAAARASRSRIEDSFRTTLALQTMPGLSNIRQGFFLVYINSFNEWHEGHQFEPMRDWSELTAAERSLGYHNAEDGRYRLDTLGALVRDVIE
jgi:hypothetical protein